MEDLIERVETSRSVYFVTAGLRSWMALNQEMILNCMQLIVIMISVYQISNFEYDIYNKQLVILSIWWFAAIQYQIRLASKMWCYAKEAFTSIMSLMHYHQLFIENEQLGKEIVYEPKQINYDYVVLKDENWQIMEI